MVEALLRTDPASPENWLLQAQLLEQSDQLESSLEACRRAAALWPDITPVYELQLRLARAQADQPLTIRTLHKLLQLKPGDPDLSSQLGAEYCAADDFQSAVPFLRVAVPVLKHANETLWNYTTALAVNGAYRELLEAEPLLDELASGAATPYPPYTHLAVAKLGLGFERSRTAGVISGMQQSAAWLDADAVSQRLADSIAAKQPFSLVRLDHALARFVCYVSPHAHRVLRPRELSAVINSVWQDWFGAPAESLGILILATLETAFFDALGGADLIGLPDASHVLHEHYHFGFLAEMQHTVIDRAAGQFASFHVADMLHEAMPYMRPILSGLPFLGLIGPHSGLASRLGHFCGIAETRSIIVPGDVSKSFLSDEQKATGFLPEGHFRTLEELSVPFPGAVFLVAAPGPLATIYCGRIKSLGGIAIDVGALTDRWAGH